MVSDGLFGNCQKSERLLPDVYQYQLTGAQRQQLESILLKLIESGYGWSHQYTQCVIGSVLLAYRSGVDFDLGFCTASRSPPRWAGDSDEEVVVPSWLTGGRSSDDFPRGIRRPSDDISSSAALEDEDYFSVPEADSQQVSDVEEFLQGLSSRDLDQLKKYVVDDLVEEDSSVPAEPEEPGVVRRLSENGQSLGDLGELMMMIFIWQRSQATRKGTSSSMLAARTKHIICKYN